MEKDQLENNNRDGIRESLWQPASLSQTPQNHSTEKGYDVLIIGGGITGITTALMLQRAGKQCILAEAKNLGYGTTGGTSAHLNTFLDSTYPEIDSDFSKEASKMLAEATRSVIEDIKSNIDGLNIDADFEYKDGFLFSQNDKEDEELQQILESSQEAGIAVSESATNGLPIPFKRALKFDQQAQFHPIKYINGLATEFERLGGKIISGAMVENTTFKDGLHQATAKDLIINAKSLVWATHIPPGINLLSLRNAPYRSYVLALTLQDGNYPDCLSYDMKEPYHYFRSHEIDGKHYLLIGGADHKTGHEDPVAAFNELESYARANFKIATIDYKWSSQYYVPVDGLPYIGQLPGGDEHTYVATGFNGNGMIFSNLSARIISDLILGKENELGKLLSPSRLKPVSGFTEFIKENADVAYRFVADRFGAKLIESTSEIELEEGKIVDFEGEKLAIYKDADGVVTALRPVCTHAGCIVNWNNAEKSWDCPCHGGRFSVSGEVITGPPRKELEKVDLS
ncbi:FAD-dependent oxidoreductase [Pedobacter petrophilus]|uniref:FAD-dependent oxidoreductase n=1 Tax=Pedobacter petrophilus TaxID=1908241 RepID=A0A7K0G428_9SPHI|nr:FAD-dependent oxidoreductase [Pedobacter petrophilus]MRX77969.1 FAD-dependent oxidoreductase [Pedobacter petrophilus]